MSHPDVIVLLARQRSGTNALRSVLDSHHDITCFNEVFNFAVKDSEDKRISEPNFFTFLEKYAQRGGQWFMPDNQITLFCDYLDYLRCFTQSRHIVIDVKYNSTHFFTKAWQPMTSPYLFELIVQQRMRLLNVTRLNYLRSMLSSLKARKSGSYSSINGGAPDGHLHVAIPELMEMLERCKEEDDIVRRHFAAYSLFLSFDYTEIFTGGSSVVHEPVLESIAKWLDIPNRFENSSNFQKQSSLPLSETIENFADVAAALRGTSFEHCLEDEPIYRRLAGHSS